MLKKIVRVVQIIAVVATAFFVVMLFVDEAPGTEQASSSRVTTTPVSVDAAALYQARCSGCHGATGGGGVGPRLAGRMEERFPDEAVQVLVVTKGSGAMPAFEGRLTDEEIKAVVEYTREELG